MNKAKFTTSEDEYFVVRDQEALARLRAKQTARDRSTASATESWRLAVTAHTEDPNIVGELQRAGITADQFGAFTLMPCFAIAWADGGINEAERLEIRAIARERGIQPNTVLADQVERWLGEPPPALLLDLWLTWVAALDNDQGRDVRRDLMTCLPDHMQRVQRAELNWLGRPSARKRRIAKRIRRALEHQR